MEEKILTEQELETVTETLSEAAKNNKDTQAIRAIVNPEDSVLPELDIDSAEAVKLDESVETLTKYSDSSSEDIITILDIKNRLAKGEKFNIFNAMPESFKQVIDHEARKMGMYGNKKFLNIMAKSIIDTLIAEANIDKEYELLQNEMSKLANIPSVADAYLENLREMMEEKLMVKAKEKREQGDSEGADRIEKVSSEFTESYSFHQQVNHLVNTKNIIGTLAKYYRKEKKFIQLMEDFDFTLSKSALKTKSTMKDAYESLLNLKLDISKELEYDYFCKSFIAITCLICRNKDYNNIADVTFMYYTITILCALKYTQNSIGLTEDIITNLKSFAEQLEIVYKKETEV